MELKVIVCGRHVWNCRVLCVGDRFVHVGYCVWGEMCGVADYCVCGSRCELVAYRVWGDRC